MTLLQLQQLLLVHDNAILLTSQL